MADTGTSPTIFWDTLKLSAQPMRGRSDILVTAHVKVGKSDQNGSDEYRVHFEINSHHGLVSYDTEVLVPNADADPPLWRYSGRRDIVVEVKNRFLTTQLYSHVAGQLGWVSAPRPPLVQAPLDP
jgi:hypothetical protein